MKRRGFRIRKKSSSQSESGSPPSPKFFSSLEQLSLSTESSEMPASSSSTGIHTYGSNTSISGSVSSSGGLLKSPNSKELTQHHQPQKLFPLQQPPSAEAEPQNKSPTVLSSSQPQSQSDSTCSSQGTNKGLHTHLVHGTPKGTRRFSILNSTTNTSRSCSSVPSSPKLGGLSSISIPLLSPCRTFFGHLTTSSSHNASHAFQQPANNQQGQKNNNSPSETKIKEGSGGGGKGLSSIFSSSSNSSTPAASPSRKPKSPLVLSPKN